MKIYAEINRSLRIGQVLMVIFLMFSSLVYGSEIDADVQLFEESGSKRWVLSNEGIRLELVYTADGKIVPSSFYNVQADVEYLRNGSLLFSYNGQMVPHGLIGNQEAKSKTLFSFDSSATGWELMDYSVTELSLSRALIDRKIGKQLSITIARAEVEIELVFEIYNGKAGIKYQTFIRNISSQKIIIETSDVLRFNLPKSPHNLHYVTNINWESTNGNLGSSAMNNKGKGVAKCLINLYDTNDGWYMAPEVNWKTQYGPEVPGSTESPTDQGYEYMHRSFAEITAWDKGSAFVRVTTCPEAFQLTLNPGDVFEYIAVNMNVFSGDIVDGKMAAERHLKKRFRFHDVSTTFVVNDWDWFVHGLRNEAYYKSVAIPQAQKAGFEMIMFDDGWNNASNGGTDLDNTGLSRDPIEADPSVTDDLGAFSDYIVGEGLIFGLWYSMSGGHHNKGNDLADPLVIAAKKEKLKYMLDHYNLSHQAVDLTQYWQNLDETDYSSPSDNVYRKNVLTRNMMNDLVEDHPQYVVKVTSELDIYPTQGDRNTDLLHLPNNGWLTMTGANNSVEVPSLFFGHLPLNAAYFGCNLSGKMEEYYPTMLGRNIKIARRPDSWNEAAVDLMARFNKWRKGQRVRELTENGAMPVFFGENWDSPVAANWNISVGPYLWMFVGADKECALLLASKSGRGTRAEKVFSLRWLDPEKDYLIEDITLDDTGIVTYNFVGLKSGMELIETGLEVNVYQNTSGAKAYWLQQYNGGEMQVVYADENVEAYAEVFSNDELTINATGLAGSTGKVVVYSSEQNDAMTVDILFDENGEGSISIDNVVNNDIPYPGFVGEVRYELEDMHDKVTTSNASIVVAKVFNGSPDSEGGNSSYLGMTALGDYATYKIPVPFEGECEVVVNFKASKSGRGESQWFVKQAEGEELSLGSAYDQSTLGNEEMRTLVLGSFEMTSAGTVDFKIVLTGGGLSGTGKALSTNYLIIRKK